MGNVTYDTSCKTIHWHHWFFGNKKPSDQPTNQPTMSDQMKKKQVSVAAGNKKQTKSMNDLTAQDFCTIGEEIVSKSGKVSGTFCFH